MTQAPTRLGGVPFRLMLLSSVLGFSGYALLLPVVPLWVAHGGSGAFGAGATTGVLMLITVATQAGTPWLLSRIGHRWVLGLGTALLGAPAPLFALSTELAPVLALSAVRGIGFGLATVAASALVAELVPRPQLGRGVAAYGLATGLPQLLLLAAGVALVAQVGFTAVFVAGGVVPLLGALLVPTIRMPALHSTGHPTAEPPPRAPRAALAGPALVPVLAMLACSIAQGGVITFLPLAVPGAAFLVAVALFATAAGALVGRLVGGELVDRLGWGGKLLRPGVLLAGAGMVVELVAIGPVGGAGVLLVVGAVAVGVGFGVVQIDSLTGLFAAFGKDRYGEASAAWNAAYDGGTGLGAVGLGAVAEPFGFASAFATSAALCGVTALASRRR